MKCARDYMTQDFQTVPPTLGLADLNAKLSECGVSGFPVTIDRRAVGVVSRTDVLRGLELNLAYAAGVGDFYRDGVEGEPEDPLDFAEEGAIAGARLARLRVNDIMTREIVSVAPDVPIAEAAQTLVDHRIHRVLVIEGRVLRGLLSTTDIARAVADGRLVPPRRE